MSLASKCPLNFARGRDGPFPTKAAIAATEIVALPIPILIPAAAPSTAPSPSLSGGALAKKKQRNREDCLSLHNGDLSNLSANATQCRQLSKSNSNAKDIVKSKQPSAHSFKTVAGRSNMFLVKYSA